MMNEKSWYFDESSKNNTQPKGEYELIPASKKDVKKVIGFYQHHPVSGYEIGSVQVIYNPGMNREFSLRMKRLNQREGNLAFKPRWENENDPLWRKSIHETYENLSAPYQDTDYPAVKLMPLWHGTKPEILPSIFSAGYANLATTDSGFFGKGIYSAYEAEYSYRVYSNGALILNWVASFSAYPVIDGDKDKLEGFGNYQNYDAHFIPVVPKNPHKINECIYLPCKPNQISSYTEMVVFESSSCLPRYLVELQATLPKQIAEAEKEEILPEKTAQIPEDFDSARPGTLTVNDIHLVVQKLPAELKDINIPYDSDEGGHSSYTPEQTPVEPEKKRVESSSDLSEKFRTNKSHWGQSNNFYQEGPRRSEANTEVTTKVHISSNSKKDDSDRSQQDDPDSHNKCLVM